MNENYVNGGQKEINDKCLRENPDRVKWLAMEEGSGNSRGNRGWESAGAGHEKGRPGKPEAAFPWSAAGKCRSQSLYRLRWMLNDNALYCGLPTSLLNHETSVTSFRAVEPIAPHFCGWTVRRFATRP